MVYNGTQGYGCHMAMKKCVKNMLRMARPDWEMNQWILGSVSGAHLEEQQTYGQDIVSGDIQSLTLPKTCTRL